MTDSPTMNPQQLLDQVPQLPGTEMERLKENAKQYVIKSLGKRPTTRSVQRSLGPLLGPEDYLAIVVFFANFIISAIHIMSLIGQVAYSLLDDGEKYGIVIPDGTFIVVHQVGFVLLAEFAMILFMVRWRLGIRRRIESWRRENSSEVFSFPFSERVRWFFSIDLALALLAVGFTLYANLSSQLPLLESVMPPLFTIGIGIHLEHLFVEMLHRQKVIRSALIEAEGKWIHETTHATELPLYRRVLAKQIWDWHTRRVNWLANQPPNNKWALVQRDLAADNQFEKYLRMEGTAAPAIIEAAAHSGNYNVGTLLEAVLQADEGSTNRIEIGSHWVDLETLTWYHGDKRKQYGPYRKYGTMIAAMKMATKA